MRIISRFLSKMSNRFGENERASQPTCATKVLGKIYMYKPYLVKLLTRCHHRQSNPSSVNGTNGTLRSFEKENWKITYSRRKVLKLNHMEINLKCQFLKDKKATRTWQHHQRHGRHHHCKCYLLRGKSKIKQ